MGSAETTDFPKDTELELDSVGTIALEGGTSSSGVIEGQWTSCQVIQLVPQISEIVIEKTLGRRER